MKNIFVILYEGVLSLVVALALPEVAQAQQSPPAGALTTFAAKAKAQGLSATDVADPLVTDSYFDASTGLTHTYLQQRVNGLVIFNATGAVHTNAAGRVVLATQDFVAEAATKAGRPSPSLSPTQAVAAAAVALGLPRPVALRTVTEARVADGVTFNNGGISREDIPVRLLYTRVRDKLVLVWNVTIAQLDQQHYWSVRVDAQTGRLVGQNDYVVSEATTFSQMGKRRLQGPATAVLSPPAPADAPLQVLSPNAVGSLTVYPVPLESPNAGVRQAVPLNSVSSTYSPYGWQVSQAPSGTFPDSYSLLSSEKYLTRGNNVAAYDDHSNTITGPGNANFNSPTTSPNGGPTLNFDFPFLQTAGPRANLDAALTNLFYWNNLNHDIMMAHGFTEAAGNFQYKNASGAGAGTDPVRAEAQDGSGRNNANFGTPPDGNSPTMQMYLWDNSPANNLIISGPASVAGTYKFASVAFGPTIVKKPLVGTIVLVNDGVSANGGDHGCATPFVNAAAIGGNIALIQRGGCLQLTNLTPPPNNAFATKVKRAQANGAVGVIVFDSLATTGLINFGGTDTAGIHIPSIFINGVDGYKLRAAILAGGDLKVTSASLGDDFDGAFDNGIISHEYGHGISNRLTGGPANTNCIILSYNINGNILYTQCMGEGWSDFFGLWMTTQPGSVGDTPRYIGNYVAAGNPTTGPGIRPKPYSTNLLVNSLTYGQVGTKDYSETHTLGEIWASTLWDLNWQFIYQYGYNADMFAATTGGNNKMLKLVLDACKIQICNPGFLEGRDALLRADTLTNGAANANLIWNVFARRGMGYAAEQGDRVDGAPRLTGIKEDFSLPPTVSAVALASRDGSIVSSALEAYPNPAQERLTIRASLTSNTPIQIMVLDLLGQPVLQTTASAAQLQQAGVELNTSHLAAGLYIVRVTTTEGIFTIKVTVQY